MLGEDFKKARSAWLYPQETLQTFWRALAIALLLFVLSLILEGIFVLPYYRFAFAGDLAGLKDAGALASPTFLAADLMAKFPVSLLVAALAIYFAKFGLPKGLGHLPLTVPKIRPFGWGLLIGCFVIFSYAMAILVFFAMGIDPAAFQGGPVEKEIADLVKNPFLFALIMPGVILGAPLIEEFIFRGALFAGLVQSPVGKPGAVIISALLWAAVHAGPAPAVVVGTIFLMGIVLALFLLRFGSLWVTIACHTAWNAVQTVMIFYHFTSN